MEPCQCSQSYNKDQRKLCKRSQGGELRASGGCVVGALFGCLCLGRIYIMGFQGKVLKFPKYILKLDRLSSGVSGAVSEAKES